jgi:hypothetical protein
MTRADLLGKHQMPSDEVPQQLLSLLVELLRSDELPEPVVGGAWGRVSNCLSGRPSLGPTATELGLFGLAERQLQALGSPVDAVSISRGKAGRAHMVLGAAYDVTRCCAGQKARPDLDAFVSSGLLDVCVHMVAAFAAAGVDGLQDVDHFALNYALVFLSKCGSYPGCESKIRGVASALAFCLEHSLEVMEELGYTTGAGAARVCCAVFGKDEGGSEFTFTPLHVQLLTEDWSQSVRAVSNKKHQKPTADNIFAAHLCVSDRVRASRYCSHELQQVLTAVLPCLLLLLRTSHCSSPTRTSSRTLWTPCSWTQLTLEQR